MAQFLDFIAPIKMRKIIIFIIFFVILLTPFDVKSQQIIYLPIIFKNPQPKVLHGLAATPFYSTCNDANLINADWYYDWQSTPYPGCENDARYTPMIWGKYQFEAVLSNAIKYNNGWIMGFNEPDYQSDISPKEAAILWRKIEIAISKTDIKLVSPAQSQHNPRWLKQMDTEYYKLYGKYPKFDAIGVHIYSSKLSDMIRYIEDRRRDYPDKKLWITEFNGCYENGNYAIMNDIIPWLKSRDYVDRYAWYVSREDNNPDSKSPCALIDAAGRLNKSGVMYLRHSN